MNLPPESRIAFIVCTFSMLGKIAAADGRTTKEEITRVERYAISELKFDKKAAALAIKVFREAASSPLDLRDYAERFQRAFPDRVQLLDQIVGILLEVSLSDGAFSREEEELVRSAALLLGLSAPGYERLKMKFLESRRRLDA